MKIINKKRKIFTSRAKYCFSLKRNTDKKVCILLNKRILAGVERSVCVYSYYSEQRTYVKHDTVRSKKRPEKNMKSCSIIFTTYSLMIHTRTARYIEYWCVL